MRIKAEIVDWNEDVWRSSADTFSFLRNFRHFSFLSPHVPLEIPLQYGGHQHDRRSLNYVFYCNNTIWQYSLTV